MKTVAVIEGFAGGPRQTKEFRQALQAAGLQVIKNRAEADIVIAHSAACYSLPKQLKARLIMFIGPPYWPRQSIARRLLRKEASAKRYIIHRYGRKYYLKKKVLEAYYILVRHKYFWIGLLRHKSLDFLNRDSRQKIILVRNTNDKFCGPAIKEAVKDIQRLKYVEILGEHDDYMKNPGPYIDLLLKELK